MEEELKKRVNAACHSSPQLLDLIPNERSWRVERWQRREFGGIRDVVAEEKDLELKLGLPCGGKDVKKSSSSSSSSSVFSLDLFTNKSSKIITSNCSCVGAKRGFSDTIEKTNDDINNQEHSVIFELAAGFDKELSQQTSGADGKAEQEQQQKSFGRKAPHVQPVNNDIVNNTSQTRTASTRVVGWPPIRSFRKNLASTPSKPSVKALNRKGENKAKIEEPKKVFLVKINMDGIPIGRKVDLKSYDNYDKLSSAVEELFQGLLAAQMDPCTAGVSKNVENKQVFAGLLDGSGQYTLVYEDKEDDRMLVGDVPWEMFVLTVKRLRVLKSSDLSALNSKGEPVTDELTRRKPVIVELTRRKHSRLTDF